MKKICVNLCLIIMLCFFSSFACKCETASTEKIPNSQYMYIMIEEKGKLAVYKTDNLNEPYYVINFDSALLPQKDQDELKKGIFVLDTKDLNRLIEDFTG